MSCRVNEPMMAIPLPIIERIRVGLKTPGLLFVGDCKMSGLDTRAYLAGHQDWYCRRCR